MMDPEGEVPWRSKEVTGAAAPQCYVQEKQTFSQIFNILRSSYDALDGLPGSDQDRVIEAKLNNAFQGSELVMSKNCAEHNKTVLNPSPDHILN